MKNKKVSIVTLGCPKNEVDSEVLENIFKRHGYTLCDPEDADVVIVNTCAFIEEAKKESIDTILDFSSMGKKVLVTGCLYQRYRKEIERLIPEVSGWFMPPGLPNYRDFLTSTKRKYAYVKLSDGCSNRCNYCAIPIIKGDLKSRIPEDILKEIEIRVENGSKEIILVSQDTTSYGLDLGIKDGLIMLINEIEKINKDFWLRIMYIHPAGFNEELAKAIATSSKITKYVEIPIQHISDNMLTIMNRRGKKAAVMNSIELINKYNLFFRTSLLVGHPGETDKDFTELINFIEEVRPWRIAIFPYSREEKTPSYNLEPLPQEIVAQRYNILNELAEKIMFEETREMIGKKVKVIIEKDKIARFEGLAPEIDGYIYLNYSKVSDFGYALITDTMGVDLEGELL